MGYDPSMTGRRTGPVDDRIQRLRELLVENADPQHARFHRAYHKSDLMFHGLRTPRLREILREVFPARSRIGNEDIQAVIRPLWRSFCWEESMLAIMLLERCERELVLADLSWLLTMTRECEGWAQLDGIACGVLSRMPLRLQEHAGQRQQFYRETAAWREDPVMWTRRASILVHIHPARNARLAQDFCWETFESRLHEKEFFIRKALGWVLREASKHYPGEVHAFLQRVGDRASGLTRREGARNLPAHLRVDILGS